MRNSVLREKYKEYLKPIDPTRPFGREVTELMRPPGCRTGDSCFVTKEKFPQGEQLFKNLEKALGKKTSSLPLLNKFDDSQLPLRCPCEDVAQGIDPNRKNVKRKLGTGLRGRPKKTKAEPLHIMCSYKNLPKEYCEPKSQQTIFENGENVPDKSEETPQLTEIKNMSNMKEQALNNQRKYAREKASEINKKSNALRQKFEDISLNSSNVSTPTSPSDQLLPTSPQQQQLSFTPLSNTPTTKSSIVTLSPIPTSLTSKRCIDFSPEENQVSSTSSITAVPQQLLPTSPTTLTKIASATPSNSPVSKIQPSIIPKKSKIAAVSKQLYPASFNPTNASSPIDISTENASVSMQTTLPPRSRIAPVSRQIPPKSKIPAESEQNITSANSKEQNSAELIQKESQIESTLTDNVDDDSSDQKSMPSIDWL